MVESVLAAGGLALAPCAAYGSAASQAGAVTRLTAPSASTQTLSKAGSSTFKTFSSPASKSFRAQKAASHTLRNNIAPSGTTIYASTIPGCVPATANGTQADPYCTIQLAVNAAVPGDTVDVLGGIGYVDSTGVTVTTSDLSIVGIGDQAWIQPYSPSGAGKPGIVLNGVTGVTISNLMVTMDSPYPSGIEVIGSSDVTIDSSYVSGSGYNPAISIDGASSNVTVSRTYVEQTMGTIPVPGIAVASGAKNVTIAGDVLSKVGIAATGVSGLDVVGDTIQRACVSAIDIEGSSSGVYLENNLLEDTNLTTDGAYGGYQAECVGAGKGWAPDVTVASAAAAGTTADYNDFYVYGNDATAPYDWAGTTYATPAAFQAGTAQGSHDTLDTKEAWSTYLRPNEGLSADMLLITGSAAIGSANTAAPGELSTDFFGKGPYNCRGAVQFIPTNPNMTVSLSGADISAFGVSVTASVANATGSVFLDFDWGDGSLHTSGFNQDGAGTWTSTHSYHKLGTYTVTVTATDVSGDVIANSMQVPTAGSDYVAYGPVRILDTRSGTGTSGVVGKVAPHGTLKLPVVGAGTPGAPIPAGTTAVVLNVTVTNPGAAGFVTAYPNQDPAGGALSVPSTSNLNFGPGQTVANLTVVPVGKDGVVDLVNASTGGTDLIADVTGYFTGQAGDGYTALTPYRLADTRTGAGVTAGKIGAGGSAAIQVAGTGGGALPTSGVDAVALNVTVTNPAGNGFLTVYPDDGAIPNASNLNFGPGQTLANAVVVPVGADGAIRVYNGSPSGAADVVIDVVGYYDAAATSAYMPVVPTRAFDTRALGQGKLLKNYYIPWNFSASDRTITGFVLNATVTNPDGPGFLTVGPDPNSLAAYQNGNAVAPTPPDSSSLNWATGQTIPNLVQASTGANGIIDFFNLGGWGATDLVVDAFGYYQNS